ncbi:MAG TPA: isoprenylcysteine carboxylmethyltransferase family protein [Acidobacteriaceae bacterium]|jgi:protein-S-isoprenylcysteine O-methyltransferase Ste14|nr:isoprenylcysteine carboxylmethyltransferase family protein [Acidobacteriaceae bacterium]
MLWIVALAEMFLCWLVWSLAFVKPSRQAAGAKKKAGAPQSRLGIGLVMLGFACLWAYVRPVGFHKPAWELVMSMVLGPPSVALAWAATRHLGKQWRYQAALLDDHELIRTGPYAWIRHPIYTSMLGMVLTTGFCWTWWPLFLAAVAVFLAGTEIRVRSEDKILAERFGDTFAEYRKSVPAYLPLVR